MKTELKGNPVPVRFDAPDDHFLHEASRQTGMSISELVRRSVRLMRLERSKKENFLFVLELSA